MTRNAGWQYEPVDFLADSEFAYSELQNQQTALQHKLTRVETNYTSRVADLQKQVVQKNQDFERQKVEIETHTTDAKNARKQLGTLQNQIAQNVAEMDRLSQQASGVNSPQTDSLSQTRMSLLVPTPEGPPAASASVVFDLLDQKGILATENLPVLTPERDYQLWLFDPNVNAAVSGGIFHVNERGSVRTEYKPSAQLRSPERFAISIERKGGSSAPSGRFVLVGN